MSFVVQGGFVPDEMKTSMIRIYGYQNKQLQGELSNLCLSKSVPFDNIIQLLFLLEQLFDGLLFPQKSMENRSFSTEPFNACVPQCDNDTEEKTVLATFTLRILFRQNASWQGTLGWSEARKEAKFRSVLELIKLMDSVLAPE